MKIRYATPPDASVLGSINIAAFQHQGFWRNVFPGIPDSVIHPMKSARVLQKLQQAQIHVLAAEDEAGSVVGYARWMIPERLLDNNQPEKEEGEAVVEPQPEPAGPGPELPPGTKEEIYEAFFGLLKEKGRGYVRDDDIILDFLGTHPSAQGKGIGTALLRWGMAEADRRGKRIYLEATTEGRPLYQKLGWVVLAEAELDYTRYGGEGSQVLTLMVREPLSQPPT